MTTATPMGADMDDFDGESIEDLFERRLLADAPKKKPSENETGEQENEAPEDEEAEDEASDESPEDETEADESDEGTEDNESEDEDEEATSPRNRQRLTAMTLLSKSKWAKRNTKSPSRT
jgi:hypothetical protein